MAKRTKRKISPRQHLIERIITRLTGGRACVKARPRLNESNAWFDDSAYGLTRRRFSDPTGPTWNKTSDDAVDKSELALLTSEQQQLISEYYKLSDEFYRLARKIELARDNIVDALKDQIILDEVQKPPKPKAFTPTQDYDAPIYLITEKDGLFLIEYHLWKKEDLIQDGDYDLGKAIIDKTQTFKYSDLKGIRDFILSTSNMNGV